MAEIDSGLGWSVVDGAFFVDTAGQIGYHEDSGAGYAVNKVNDGASICVGLVFPDGNYKAVLLSTVKSYAEMSPSDKTEYVGEFEFDTGETDDITGDPIVQHWFAYWTTEDADSMTIIGGYPVVSTNNISNQTTVEIILTEAGVHKKKKIPTIGYVHEFVEGVMKKMPYMTINELNTYWNS